MCPILSVDVSEVSKMCFVIIDIDLKIFFFLLSFLLIGSHLIAKAGIELSTLLAQPSKCWDY
jgi:hypothetical protein